MNSLFLKDINYFSWFSDEELSSIQEYLDVVELKPGEPLLIKGDRLTDLYFIKQGSIKVLTERLNAEPIEIDVLYDDAVFGQEFIFPETRAKFSYYCNAPKTELVRLSFDKLKEFLEKNRLTRQKFEEQIRLKTLKNFINSGKENYNLDENKLLNVIKESELVSFSKDETIWDCETQNENVFVILEGIAAEENLIASARGSKKYYGGDVLGKVSVDIGKDLKTNFTALTKCVVLVVKKIDLMLFLFEQEGFEESFDKVIEEFQQKKEKPKKAESAGKEEWDSEDEIPEYDYKIPLKHKLGFYPGIKQQSQMDCGAACIVNICKYYGKSVSMNRMRELTRVGRSGASMYNILMTLKNLGFHTIPYLSTYDDLKKCKNPSIVNWKGYHWIVVYKITDDKVIVGDPGKGRVSYTKEEFIESWTRYTLVINPSNEIQNIEESKPSLKQFSSYFKPYKKNIREILLASLSLQIFNILLPLFTKFILDNVIVNEQQEWLYISILAISLISVLIAVLGYVRQRLILFVSFKANTKLIGDFFKQILNLPLKFFEARKTGDITTRFQENEKITDFMTNTGMQVFLDMFTAVVYLGIMFYMDVSLTVIITFFIILQLFIYYVITPRIKQTFREVFEKNAESESYLIESLKGISTIKSLGVENPTRWKWQNLQVSAINSYFKTIKYSMGTSLSSGLVNHLSDVAVLFYGAVLVLENEITIGSLIAFTVMAKGVAAPVIKVASSWNIFQEVLNSVERLNDVLESEPEVIESEEKEKIKLPSLRGYIKMDNLTFRYERDSKENVLQNISFEIEPGQRVAFVGRSGSGKSTLIKLIYRFYKPTSGNIFIDGFDLENVSLPTLRKHIGLVPQENDLFKGTIRENIAKAKPNSTLREIIEAAKLANAHEFISSFPEGYNTMLEEGGSNLSGGQRQRIAIARTFIQKPKILILDEATSALDNESERKIQSNIDEQLKNTTVIMIAHRLSTVQNADKIIVLDKGNIIEQGDHQQLINNRGLYYYLANQQLSL